jgi:lactoylglutathione lyase
MRTLHFGLRVSDLERSLAFYTAVGSEVVGSVDGTACGSLTMLQLPDDDFVSIELVHDPATGETGPGVGINHLVIQVESLDTTRAGFVTKGLAPEAIEYPGGVAGPRTCWITDPDGYRIELVQWPDGHGDGMTKADFA